MAKEHDCEEEHRYLKLIPTATAHRSMYLAYRIPCGLCLHNSGNHGTEVLPDVIEQHVPASGR
jgi:hypothetical protein